MARQAEHHQAREKLSWGTGDIKFPPVTPVTCAILSCSHLEEKGDTPAGELEGDLQGALPAPGWDLAALSPSLLEHCRPPWEPGAACGGPGVLVPSYGGARASLCARAR